MKAKERINNYLKELSIENVYIPDYINAEDISDYTDAYNEIYEMLNDKGAFNVEIIYYSTAIEFLTQNDNSLTISLGLASELGFNCENLNSETLASLLASELARDEFSELETEITDFFNVLIQEKEELINDIIAIDKDADTDDLDIDELQELLNELKDLLK